MTMTRREFLRNTGLAAAYLALPAWLSACQRGSAPAAESLAAPQTWDDPQPGAHADIVHLLNRITYGPRPGEVKRVAAIGWDTFLEQQLHPDQIDDAALDERLRQFPTLTMSSAELFASYPPKGKPGPRAIILDLEAASLLRAIASERQMFEIMVDFWSNHLNIFIGKNQVKWLKTADDREVMELHTVGADGGYTQDDVTTVARALTGWTISRRNTDPAGEFHFAPRLHDDDAKQIAFLNLALPAGGGLKDGEALLAALASHPNTAARIAHKLCVTFVADDPPQALVERAAKAYLDS